MTITHFWCPSSSRHVCRVHWWRMPEGSLASYPIRVPNWHQIRTLTFEPAPEHGELPLYDPVTIVYVGPDAPFPSLPPVRFHIDTCNSDTCDGGCLYG